MTSALAAAAERPAYAREHVLVHFKSDAGALLPAVPKPEQLTLLLRQLPLPDAAELREAELTRLRRQQRKAIAPLSQERVDLGGFFFLRLPRGLDVTDCLRRLENHPLLEYAEPDWVGTVAETIPNDPSFTDQWHHQNPDKPSACIQTPLAWDITHGSSNVLVAVLDTGLAELPEFANRAVPGYNFAYTNSDTTDDNGHGTQVTGVLAANANNAMAGAGVDWNCRVMPVKVFDAQNMGFYSSWAQGIDFAVSNGCKIINLSGAGTEFSRTVQRAITNAIAHGVIFVTAAGNLGDTNLSFPGYLTQCITVGATDREDRRAPFSNSGPQLDLVAPGADVITIGVLNSVDSVGGTSFATAMVSGVCALLAALRPGLTQADARLLLCAGAEDQVGDSQDLPGFDTHYGWGRLNAFNSLLLATTRIDYFVRTNDVDQLAWVSPPNAQAKQSYRVEYSTSLTGSWIPLSETNAFSYLSNRVVWSNKNEKPQESRFYRVALRTL